MVSDIELDADEKIIYRVNRSIVGLIPAYLAAGITLVGVLFGVFQIARNQQAVSQNMPIGLALLLILGTGLLIGMVVYLFINVYKGNRMIITNERVVMFTQRGVFHQSVPQLNLVDVQEVTVHQHGMLSHLFNYGSIVVETAGEQKNIILKYAQNPHLAVKQIDDAAETYKRAAQPRIPPVA